MEYERLESDESDGVVEVDSADSFDTDSSDDVPNDPNELLFYDSFLESVGGVDNIASGSIPSNVLRDLSAVGWEEPELCQHGEPLRDQREAYPNLFEGDYGPSSDAIEAAASPLTIFLHFMPVRLWQHIANETNDYFEESIDRRVREHVEYQAKRKEKLPSYVPKSEERIRRELNDVSPVEPHELCIMIGLMIARSLCPQREKLSKHWKRDEEGAIPRGTFTPFMTRDRFMHLLRNLHFSSNGDSRAQTDRGWKIRPVIQTLQSTFKNGYSVPPIISFDEAMLPSRSSFNRTRVYMKDKPHKWGTKLFMACCAKTAYCLR